MEYTYIVVCIGAPWALDKASLASRATCGAFGGVAMLLFSYLFGCLSNLVLTSLSLSFVELLAFDLPLNTSPNCARMFLFLVFA